MHMAIHTPRNPIVGAKMRESERRTTQMLPKFIRLGTKVLPEPTNTP